MSNILAHTQADCREHTGDDSQVAMIITPREKDLGGFSVRRVLPFAKRRMVGPWIFFDEMGPAPFAAGEGINVRPHPHIGLATVTYLFEGEITHRDSLGSHLGIRPGAINLMVAGRGIVHSERKPARSDAYQMHGLQLWHALPKEWEMTDPAFHHYSAESIPETVIDGVAVRVMMGDAYGLTSPVKTFCETLYAEARLPAGASLALPQVPELACYVVEGAVSFGESQINAQQMAIFEDQATGQLHATSDCRLVFIGGESLGERHIEWNFVASDPALIAQAKADWLAGRFPTVPGDEDEFIPLPQ